MTTPAMVRIRFRSTVTLGENVHQANSIETVEANEEAWALVDKGVADLEPGPGIGGQPFPPWAPATPPDVITPQRKPETPPPMSPPERHSTEVPSHETPDRTRRR